MILKSFRKEDIDHLSPIKLEACIVPCASK